MTQEEGIAAGENGRLAAGINRLVHGITRHWLALFNAVVAVYVGLAMLLAPLLMLTGATGAARVLYTLYSPLCHQMASRSYFLFGEQIAYPRAAAETSLTPIESYMHSLPEFAGVSTAPEEWTGFLWASRRFLGNEQMGYKMALCERDIAIYGAVLLGGLLYAVLRSRKARKESGIRNAEFGMPDVSSPDGGLEYRQAAIRPLPIWVFLLIGLGPIALDGFSQLFSQYIAVLVPQGAAILHLLPLRESTPLLRTVTGALFGLSLVWMTYPHIDKSMQQTAESQRRRLPPVESQNLRR